MPLRFFACRIFARQLGLLLLAPLCPAIAFAASETYEGQLIARNNDAPIPIVLRIEDVGGFLSGTVRTSYPLKGDATIESGRNIAGICNLVSALSASVTLRLYGNCSGGIFEGNYTIHYPQARSIQRGTFRLMRKVSDSSKAIGGFSSADGSASTKVACIKANTRCLSACPRDNTDAEYLCAHRCRSKLQACKGKAAKIEAEAE